MTPAVWNFICVCLQFLQKLTDISSSLSTADRFFLFSFCQSSQGEVRDSDQRQHFEVSLLFSFPLAAWNQLCFNVLCLGTFMVLRKELQTLLEEIWFWNKCCKYLKIACCSCTVHDVHFYSAHTAVLWAALAVGIYLWACSGSRPWI